MQNRELASVPDYIVYEGELCMVISTMENYHYRALILRRLNNPLWLSNEEVAMLTTKEK